jgi:hypothetical protein
MLAEHARAGPLFKSVPVLSWLCPKFDPFTPNVANHQSEANRQRRRMLFVGTASRTSPALRIRNAFEFHHLAGYRSRIVRAPRGDQR